MAFVDYPSKRLALELALMLEGSGETLQDLVTRHDLTPLQLEKQLSNAVFRAELTKLREEVRDKGLTFRVKARAMAEEMLKTTWQLVHDPTASFAVRADLIKSVVEWGGFKPKADNAAVSDGGVKVIINFSGKPQEIDVSPPSPLLQDLATNDET